MKEVCTPSWNKNSIPAIPFPFYFILLLFHCNIYDMICPQCNGSKIAVVDHKHTCVQCGTVLADVTDDDHVMQTIDRNNERQRIRPEGSQSSRDVKEETRRVRMNKCCSRANGNPFYK